MARHDGRRPLARVAVVARVAEAAAAPLLLALARRHTLGRHAARRRPDAVAAAALLGLAGERGERRGKVLGVGLQPPLVALLLDLQQGGPPSLNTGRPLSAPPLSSRARRRTQRISDSGNLG